MIIDIQKHFRKNKDKEKGLKISEIKDLVEKQLDLVETNRLFKPLISSKIEDALKYKVAINLLIEVLNDDFKKTIDLCFEQLDYGEAQQMPVEVLFSAGQIIKNTVKNLEI